MIKQLKIVLSSGLLALIIGIIVYQHIKATEVDIVLSCRNELVATNPKTHVIEHHSLIADFALQKRSASISYRYFTSDGIPIATLHLKGDVLSANKDKDIYILNLVSSELIRHNSELSLPLHAKHLEAFASRNITKEGVHNLTIQIASRNQTKNTALLYFLPSTNICACSLVTMG
ncbi:hypothetical protein CXF83_06470 [Shewanella sp. Choline-02u-19]|uniref:hypothetical protein n=1 Tax=unclassified Shewanella TaxID=196818 RepID=UPI000C33669E|nr:MULTISPECIES: hypothetical protein [unclassified Shewanella]PKG58556.1 hypothetical protein CXF82_03955 [Shewanella sp. GutDb-MelDb]PKH56726.1 hypothetical protein CXF84_12490 [Shewanella sp. Bg11-22]PKI30277.1 hypothetical protein CXF83_06470 [Shewanella sp. Choline-02u-19]